MHVVLERIAAWQAAGLIDTDTAVRLRAAEAEDGETPSTPEGRDKPSTVAQIVGPSVTIGEMFAYPGGAFILGAFDAFLTRMAGFDADGGVGLAVGFGVVALVLVAIGRFMAQGDARQRRAAKRRGSRVS